MSTLCLSLASPLGLEDHYGGYEDLHSYDFGHENYDHGQISRISLGDHHEYEHHGHEHHDEHHHEEEHVDYYVSIFLEKCLFIKLNENFVGPSQIRFQIWSQ